MTEAKAESFEGWAILELMGHRKMAGRVSEAVVGGASFVRIDVPADGDAAPATQFYAPGAVYCITPTTEEMARAVAETCRPAPVSRWELPQLPAKTKPEDAETYDEGEEF